MEIINENRVFKRAYNKGKKQAGRYLVLYYVRRQAGTRYGITVSKKIGKAVKRNRIRRLIKENLRAVESNVKPGYDIIVVSRGACLHATFWDVKKQLDTLLRKAELFNMP